METDEKKFDKLKKQVKEDYTALGEIRCPYFNGSVHFSSEGFKHILYKGSTKLKRRDRNSQFTRLQLFKLAPKLLRLTKTVQEHYADKQFVPVRHNKRKEKVLKEICYWGFVAILGERRIKVIVKQIGNGKKKFWSIIPNWGIRKTDKGDRMIIQHTGDLEND